MTQQLKTASLLLAQNTGREIRYLPSNDAATRKSARRSAIRRVIHLRLTGNGLLWKEANAEGMIVLRAAALTRQWRETLEHVRESMASNRRLDWKWQSPDMPLQLEDTC